MSSERSVRAAYDAIARPYAEQFDQELAGKPLDRALLAAFLELCGDGTVGDVGCGPGQVARALAERHPSVVGVDLSPEMIRAARRHGGRVRYVVGSMLALPIRDGAWAGMIAFYSIIHLTADERGRAFREFARVTRPGGPLLVAFHVDSPQFAAGAVNHVTSWFGRPVDIDGHYLHPEEVIEHARAAGGTLAARLDREPVPGAEHPSRRSYQLIRTG